MECYTREIQSHKERGTDCNINDTWISDKTSCIHFVISKNRYVLQNHSPPDGFQPPSLKKDAYLYIKW